MTSEAEHALIAPWKHGLTMAVEPDRPPISADWRNICTIVIIAAGKERHRRCANGQAKAAAVCCGRCLSAPSAKKRCINPRFDGNPRKPISPRQWFLGF
jgi:hypothetical protein